MRLLVGSGGGWAQEEVVVEVGKEREVSRKAVSKKWGEVVVMEVGKKWSMAPVEVCMLVLMLLLLLLLWESI